jgi:hypothetical protein
LRVLVQRFPALIETVSCGADERGVHGKSAFCAAHCVAPYGRTRKLARIDACACFVSRCLASIRIPKPEHPWRTP